MLQITFPVGPLACNCSIVADATTREAMVIDPGDEIEDILRRVREQGWQIRQIAVTHAHIDHIGGAARLKAITGAPIALHPADQQLYDQLDWQAEWLGVAPPERTAIDGALRESETLRLGGLRFEILDTPGHTPGSVCLYAPGEAKLFAGDTLFAGSIGRTDLPGGDSRQILRSLREKILALPDTTAVIPGHGEATMIGQERAHNPFLTGHIRLP